MQRGAGGSQARTGVCKGKRQDCQNPQAPEKPRMGSTGSPEKTDGERRGVEALPPARGAQQTSLPGATVGRSQARQAALPGSSHGARFQALLRAFSPCFLFNLCTDRFIFVRDEKELKANYVSGTNWWWRPNP